MSNKNKVDADHSLNDDSFTELQRALSPKENDIAEEAQNTLVKDPVVQEPPASRLVENQLVTEKPQVDDEAEENSVQEVDEELDEGPKDHPMKALGQEMANR